MGFLRQAWLVILLACVYGAALAGVHTSLAPRIAENKQRETFDVIPLLIEGAAIDQTVSMTIQTDDGEEQRVYKTFSSNGRHNGWVLPVSGQGFVDKIELLLGLNDDLSRLTGMYVLDQKETPGLGDRIRGEQFVASFDELPIDTPLTVVKTEPHAAHEIQAVSGATISSWAVCEMVNSAIAELREPLLRQMKSSH